MNKTERINFAKNLLLSYFKTESLSQITNENILTFQDKYFYDIHNKDSIKDFCEAFKTEENIFWTTSCILSDLLTCNKIRTKKYIEITINNRKIQVFRKSLMTIKLIVEDFMPLFFTLKEKCLGNVSLTENGKFWYSHIASDKEEYLDIKSFSERGVFVETIISLLEENEVNKAA